MATVMKVISSAGGGKPSSTASVFGVPGGVGSTVSTGSEETSLRQLVKIASVIVRIMGPKRCIEDCTLLVCPIITITKVEYNKAVDLGKQLISRRVF